MILHFQTQKGNQTAHLYRAVSDRIWSFQEGQEATIRSARARLADMIFETWEVDIEELDSRPADMHWKEWQALKEHDVACQTD